MNNRQKIGNINPQSLTKTRLKLYQFQKRLLQFRVSNLRSSFLFALGLGILSIFGPISTQAAERLAFSYPPFGEFYIRVNDLEILAKEGRITDELAYFTNRLSPEQLEKFKDLLSRKIELNPLAIYKFTRFPIGEIVLKNIGTAVKADVNKNGFFALRGAIMQAALDEDGLTLVNMLRQFPLDTIYLETAVVLRCIEEAGQLLREKELIVAGIKQEYRGDLEQVTNTESIYKRDLSALGPFTWKKETLEFQNPNRPTSSAFDLYLPQSNQEVNAHFATIVISHGLASNRGSFAYLAEHLASQGFAVAIPEHIGTESEQFQKIFSGLAKPPEATNLINRPLDLKYLLDKLEQESATNEQLKGKLDLGKVGVLGQSFGGYTALAVGGAQHNRAKLEQECAGNQHDNVFFDMSALIQCRVNELPQEDYQLQDERIKAILAINPLSNKIFGKEGLEKIQLPTMIISGVNDIITPPVQEQIYPFAWLTTPNKYLVLVEAGTHFSFLSKGKGVLPIPSGFIGPEPELAFPALKALSTAFFKTYIAAQSEYAIYLDSTYIQSLNSQPFEFSVVESLTEAQLETLRSTVNE